MSESVHPKRDTQQAKQAILARLSLKLSQARTVSYALKEAVEEDLKRLQRLGVLEKVNHSDWMTPVVPVPKAVGSVKLCDDFKVTLIP